MTTPLTRIRSQNMEEIKQLGQSQKDKKQSKGRERDLVWVWMAKEPKEWTEWTDSPSLWKIVLQQASIPLRMLLSAPHCWQHKEMVKVIYYKEMCVEF